MMKLMIMILAIFAISCFGSTMSGGTERSPFSKLTARRHIARCTQDDPEKLTQDKDLDTLISKQQRQIEQLRRNLLEQEKKLDKLLIRSHSSEHAHKTAILLNTETNLGGVTNEAPNGFRKGDHLVFVHRTAEGITMTGGGLIAKVYPHDAELDILGPLTMQPKPEDEVYISNRGDSIYSLALLRF